MSSPDDQQPPKLTLDAIDSGLPLVQNKTAPDPIDLLEKERTETLRLTNKLHRARIKDVKADRSLRKQYASRILRFLEWYAIGVGLMILLDGFHFLWFHLEKEVAAALVGSTAIAAIGLVGFIAKGLFRPPPPPPSVS